MKVDAEKTESVVGIEVREGNVYMTGEISLVYDSKSYKKKADERLIDKWPIKINGQATTKEAFIAMLQAVYDA
jgi:hypothetical protein